MMKAFGCTIGKSMCVTTIGTLIKNNRIIKMDNIVTITFEVVCNFILLVPMEVDTIDDVFKKLQ